MSLLGTIYGYGYNPKRKEVMFKLQIGSIPEIQIVMGAESFIPDLDFMAKDKKLVHFISEVRKRKDLPTDHKFEPGEEEIRWKEEWDNKMGQ